MKLIESARALLSFKRSEPVSRIASSLTSEVAVNSMMSTLMRMPDQDEVLRKLGVKRDYLGKLLSDDDIYGAVSTRRDKLIGTPRRLEGGNEAMNVYLLDVLAPHIDSILRCQFNGLLFGYSVGEIVFADLSGGKYGIARVQDKPLRWFDITQQGELRYFAQNSATPVLCDPEKFIVTVVNPSYENPLGESLLSRLYWAWFFRTSGWNFWIKNLERFSDPLLLATVGDPQAFIQKISELGIQNIVAVGQDEGLQAVAKSGDSAFQMLEDAVLKRYYRLILGQTLTSGADGGGSYALGNVHDQVRSDKRNSDIQMVKPGIQRLINTLARLNFPGQVPPTFEMSDDVGIEQERAIRDATLVNAGVVKLTEAYLLDRYDFNAGDIEMPVAQPVPAALEKAIPPAKKLLPGIKASAEKIKFTPQQQAVEDVADAVLANTGNPIPAEKLRAVLMAATGPEDLAHRFAVMFGKLNHEAYAAGLERALFVGDVLGYAHAAE